MTGYGFVGLLALVAMVVLPVARYLHQVRRLQGIRIDTVLTSERIEAIYAETVCGGFRAHTWRTEAGRAGFGRAQTELRTTNTAWRSTNPPDVTLNIHDGDSRTPTTCFLRTTHRPTLGNGAKISRLLRSFRRFERAIRVVDPDATVTGLA